MANGDIHLGLPVPPLGGHRLEAGVVAVYRVIVTAANGDFVKSIPFNNPKHAHECARSWRANGYEAEVN